MKKFSFKRAAACALAIAMVGSAFAGCSNSNTQSNKADAGTSDTQKPVEKKKVLFWYLWSGDGAKRIDGLLKDYNAKSDKYEVEGLSVPDSQKIMAAISSGNGPDVTDDFAGNIGKFASTGIMEPLDDYIANAKYDLSDFIPASIEACKMDGKQFALPCNVNFSGLYYNKTLLKEAGYNEPPKTMEEMYTMAEKTTKKNADGTIDVCGFPDFPNVYYLGSFVPAAGGGWYTKDSKAAPADTFGNKYALKLARDYREKFGLENIVKFSSGGKYLDPTDPFLKGKQTFRIDGPWMGHSIKEQFKADVDYGVTNIPYPKDKPEFEGRQEVSCSILFVTANSQNKEGAFDFLSYFVGPEGQDKFTIAGGDFPSRLSMLENENFKKGYDTEFYSQLAKSKNLVAVPANPKCGEYQTLINEQTELCLNLKQDIDTTLKNIYEKGQGILG